MKRLSILVALAALTSCGTDTPAEPETCGNSDRVCSARCLACLAEGPSSEPCGEVIGGTCEATTADGQVTTCPERRDNDGSVGCCQEGIGWARCNGEGN